MSDYTNHLFSKAARKKVPLGGTFELTPMCNLSCKMCYVRLDAQRLKQLGKSLLDLEDWLRLANEAKEAGMLYLLLTGGEPLTYPSFKELYESLYDMGLLISINTNGTLITDDLINLWKRKPPKRVNITLYGSSSESYKNLCGRADVFDTVISNLLKLKESRILIRVNFSVTPENSEDVSKVIEFTQKHSLFLSLTDYMFPPARRNEYENENVHRLPPREAAKIRLESKKTLWTEERFKKYCAELASLGLPAGLKPYNHTESEDHPGIPCRMGKSNFWVTWDGKLLACGMVNSIAVEDGLHGPFSERWSQLNEIVDSIHSSLICRDCDYNSFCHPCIAKAVAETERYDEAPEYCCEMMKHLNEIAKLEELQNSVFE